MFARPSAACVSLEKLKYWKNILFKFLGFERERSQLLTLEGTALDVSMACRQTFHLLVSLSLLASTQAMIGDGCIAIPSIVKNLHRSDSSTKLHTAPAARLAPVQGVHLAIEGPDTVRVTWENPASPSSVPFNPQCVYGPSPSNLSLIAVGSSYSYTAGLYLEVGVYSCEIYVFKKTL